MHNYACNHTKHAQCVLAYIITQYVHSCIIVAYWIGKET